MLAWPAWLRLPRISFRPLPFRAGGAKGWILAAGICLLATGAGLGVLAAAVRAGARHKVARVEQRWGVRLEVDRVGASWLKPGRMTLEGVSVRVGRSTIDLDRVYVRYRLLPLLVGRVSVASVQLDKGTIALALDDETLWSTLARVRRRRAPSEDRGTGPRLELSRLRLRATSGDFEVAVSDLRGSRGGGTRGLLRTGRSVVTAHGPAATDVVLGALAASSASFGESGAFEGLQIERPHADLGAIHERRERIEDVVRALLTHTAAGATGAPAAASRPAAHARRMPIALRATDGRIDLPADRLEAVTLVARLDPRGALALDATASGRLRSSGGRVSAAIVVPRDGEPIVDVTIERMPLTVLTGFVPRGLVVDPEHATLRAGARIQLTAEGRLGFDGAIAIEGVALDVPRVASAPIRDIAIDVRARGSVDPRLTSLRVDEARVRSASVELSAAGELTRTREGSAIRFEVTLPETPCNRLLRALPSALLGNLAGLSLSGTFAGQVRLSLNMANLDATDLAIDLDNRCRVESADALASIDRLRQPFLHQVEERPGQWREFVTGPGSPDWTPFDAISPHVVNAVLTTEDGGFFSHSGFTVREIRGAIVTDLRAGRFAYGASTISMQTAKNVFLTREKTLARKFQEAILTWVLEQNMAKEEILELYLNVIEFGPALYGIRTASRFFFDKEPALLEPIEAAYLASVLPSPARHYRNFERGQLSDSWASWVRRIVRIMHDRGRLSDEDFARSESAVVVFRGANAPVPAAAPAASPDSAGPESPAEATPASAAPPPQAR